MVFILNTGTGNSWLWLCVLLSETPWDAVGANEHCIVEGNNPRQKHCVCEEEVFQETWWHEAWILVTKPAIDSKVVFIFILV